MKFELKTACAKCPFRTDAMKGYVGPYDSASELIATAKHTPFACHMGPGNGEPAHPDATHCYGAAVMANKSCHSSRDPEVRVYQRKVGGADTMIMDQWEAHKHHGAIE